MGEPVGERAHAAGRYRPYARPCPHGFRPRPASCGDSVTTAARPPGVRGITPMVQGRLVRNRAGSIDSRASFSYSVLRGTIRIARAALTLQPVARSTSSITLAS